MIPVNRIETPTYLYDEAAFLKNVYDVISIIRSRYRNFKLAYSYKTNYFNGILRAADDAGLYAEVVSPQEFDDASWFTNGNLNRVIYNGVIPDFENKIRVAMAGGIVNIENMLEFLQIDNYANATNKVVKIGIRVNFDLDNGLTSRFGFDVDGDDFKKIVKSYSHPLVIVDCIHFQFGGSAGGLRTPKIFRRRVSKAVEIAKMFGATKVDIGGNIIGRLDKDFTDQFPYDVPTMEDVCYAIGDEMARVCPDESIELIAECGSALVTNAMHLLTTITNVNVVRGKTFATCDCRKSDVGWSANRFIPSHKFFGETTKEVSDAIICGCECREEDVILRKYSGPLTTGGKILIKNVGAYSYSITNDFITSGCSKVISIEDVRF